MRAAAGDVETASEVRGPRGVLLEEHLHPPEPQPGLEMPGQLDVGEGVDRIRAAASGRRLARSWSSSASATSACRPTTPRTARAPWNAPRLRPSDTACSAGTRAARSHPASTAWSPGRRAARSSTRSPAVSGSPPARASTSRRTRRAGPATGRGGRRTGLRRPAAGSSGSNVLTTSCASSLASCSRPRAVFARHRASRTSRTSSIPASEQQREGRRQPVLGRGRVAVGDLSRRPRPAEPPTPVTGARRDRDVPGLFRDRRPVGRPAHLETRRCVEPRVAAP